MLEKDAADLIAFLEENGLEVYVDGGWAVDAVLGEQTRPHDDLDIAMPHAQVSRLRAILSTRGFHEHHRDDSWECNFVLTDEAGADSWPLAGATFILMHKVPQDAVAAREALKFFDWAYAKGGKMAEELDYVPMPDKVVGAIQKEWAARIKDASGKPLHALSN